MGKKCDTVHGTLLMHCMSVRLCGGVRAMLRIDSCEALVLKFYQLRALCLASFIAVSLYTSMG